MGSKRKRNWLDGMSTWLPAGGLPSSQFVRPEQKRQEMNLADLVLVPSKFVATTVRAFHPHKKLAQAFYGVDLEFLECAGKKARFSKRLRFIFAGRLLFEKGIPLLLEAWGEAALRDAELELGRILAVGRNKATIAAQGVIWRPPCSPNELRERYLAC